MQYGTQKVSSSSTTNGWASGAIQVFIYDGTNWVRDYWSNTTYTVPGAISTTAASTSAKTASATNYKLRANSHFEITLSNSNTAQSALTLNIESTGAKSIYINKKASSASNYTLPAGKYIVFYDGNYYHFTTDGTIPGLPEDKNTTYTLTQNGTDITLEGNDGSSQTVSDSHVTSVDNHYTPTTNTNSALTANANSTTSASWGSTDIVTGVTLNRDAAGHVTGISVSSKQFPANPNTNTTYTLTEDGSTITLTGTDGSSQTVSDSHVTSVSGHYTPSKSKTINASSTTAASWGSTDFVTGIEMDAAGHVTGVVSKQFPVNPDTNTTYEISKDGSTITLTGTDGSTSSITDSDTTYSAGTGLSLSGTKFNHSNSITAGTVSGSNGSLSYSGSFIIPKITYDAQGHITKTETTTVTLPRAITAADLGLSSAMIYLGESTTAITQGGSQKPTIGGSQKTPTAGNVVIYGTNEYVYNSLGTWELLGGNGDYKVKQTAVSDPTASAETSKTFIASISQDANGKITAVKKVIDDTNTTYTLSENGSTITLTGTDGSTSSVTDSDSKVTSVGNHYTPTANTNSTLTANANSTSSASWGSTDVVTGITLNRDAAGHVTGVSVSSKQFPANPDTNTTYSLSGSTRSVTLTGSDGSSSSATLTGSVSNRCLTLTFTTS